MRPPARTRAAVVIIEEGKIAVIERQLGDNRWYVLPGGGVEEGETSEQAAIREAAEELGLEVSVGPLLAEADREGPNGTRHSQLYFAATIVGGVWGSGTGEELSRGATSAKGTYRPQWLVLERAAELDARPASLFAALTSGSIDDLILLPLRVLD